MAWLTQNWLFVLLLLGVVVLLSWRGGMGCGVVGHRGHAHRDAPPEDAPRIDPVSREPVTGDSAIVATYRGRIYYFNSRENRDRFEATPDRFVSSAEQGQGHAHGHGGHGCC